MKILVVRFSSIGDIVLTSPVVRCLKQQLNGAGIHFLVKESFLPVVQHNPHIDKVHVLAHSWELMMEELLIEEYDLVIDLQRNRRSRKLIKELGVKSYAVNKLNIRKYILTAFKINLLPKKHIVDRYLDTVKSLAVQNDGNGLDYFISKKEETGRDDIPGAHWAGYIACVIGAAHGTKRWPVEKWKSFCKKMDHPIILLGGKEDRERGREIASVDDMKVYNACGKFTLNESADLVKKAKLVISNDTGLMHIAAAFQKPVISLWGNTVPSFGMTPYYGSRNLRNNLQEQGMMQVKGLWCRPCSKIGYEKCPLGHFKCMQKINEDQLIAKAKSLL
jgi:heptosyltransferase-2